MVDAIQIRTIENVEGCGLALDILAEVNEVFFVIILYMDFIIENLVHNLQVDVVPSKGIDIEGQIGFAFYDDSIGHVDLHRHVIVYT